MTANLDFSVESDLFLESLIKSYVTNNPRFLRRDWLAAEVEAGMAKSNCRFVLLTAEPGAGKTAFMAQLAKDHSTWPRYFIRRDQHMPLEDGGARGFLEKIGFQLAALYPEAFQTDAVRISISLVVERSSGQITGADVDTLVASPFYSKAVEIIQEVKVNQGNLTGIRVRKLVTDPGQISLLDLQRMAILAPALALQRLGHTEPIVILIDALDELRYRPLGDTVLDRLIQCPELPANVRVLVTSRPDLEWLAWFRSQQGRSLVEKTIPQVGEDICQDLTDYAGKLVAIPEVESFLMAHKRPEQSPQAAMDQFVVKVVKKAGGNLGYLDAVGRAIDQAVAGNDLNLLKGLLKLEQLPGTLKDLYGHFLKLLRGSIGDTCVTVEDPTSHVQGLVNKWTNLYRPVLGVLAVTMEPLTISQIRRLGRMLAGEDDVSEAIGWLRQFLDQQGSRFTFYHSTLPEFLVSQATQENPEFRDLAVDPAVWHERIVDSYRGPAVSWKQVDWRAVDDYGLRHIPSHLIQAMARSDLVAVMTDLTFITAKCTAGLVDDLLSDFEASQVALAAEWDEAAEIAHFSRFVRYTSHLLRVNPEVCYQEAYNSAEQYVSRAAIDLLRNTRFPTIPWLRKTAGTARQHHSGQVISMAFWGDDRYLAVSTTERQVWVWDTIQGALWHRCETPPSAAKSLAVSPDGELLAAGFGAADPNPFVAGVVVWARNGNVRRSYSLEDWVYTVRWRHNDELLIGAGLPTGSDAVGRLFRATVTGATCDEIGRFLADRPIVLTWDPLPAQPDQIMVLSMDGVVCHLTPAYIPPTPDELSEISLQLLADGDYDGYDARLAERRPISHRLNAPCLDEFGFHSAVQSFGQNMICMLGEPPVPPELFAWHTPDPDGIYFYDLESGRLRSFSFSEEARSGGFKATCLATTSKDGYIAIGTSHGQAYLFHDEGDRPKPGLVHQGRFPVTAVCFSSSGERVAVGDAGAELAVYNRADGSLVFKNGWAERPVTARVRDSQAILLYRNRLEWVTTSTNERGETIPLTDGLLGLDFDYCGSLGVVLCSPADVDEDTGGRRTILVVDLAARQVVLRAEIPPRVPGPSQDAATSEPASYVNTIRVYVDDAECRIILGSAQGLISYPLLAFESGRTFVLPEAEVKRQREITVMRLGLDVPEISCEVFALASEQAAIICGYADNADHPNISGEIRVWNLEATQYSMPQSFSSAVRVLESTGEGVFVVGEEHGDASSWRFDGEWRRMAGARHPVAVVAVAYSPERRMVCSTSQDGLIIVWCLLDGLPLLKTYLDVEPICVGFLQQGRSLCVIDREGEAHIWEIEGMDALLHDDHQVGEKTATGHVPVLIQQCLDGAAHLNRVLELSEGGEPNAAKALLDALPDMPNGRQVQQYWHVKLSKKLDENRNVKAVNLRQVSSLRNRKKSSRTP